MKVTLLKKMTKVLATITVRNVCGEFEVIKFK